MSRALRALAALSVASAALPVLAAGFLRTTTVEGHPDQGLWLWWRPRDVTYKINRSTFDDGSIPGCTSAATAAVNSFPTWTTTGTDFTYVDGGDTATKALGGDGTNLVVVRHSQCTDVSDPVCQSTATIDQCISKYNCWSHDDPNALALTSVSYLVSTGEIVDADMELNGWNGSTSSATATGFYFTCLDSGSKCPPVVTQVGPSPYYGELDCIAYDAANTVTHEAGHMLGLDHPCEFPSQNNPTPFINCNDHLANSAEPLVEDTMFPSADVGEVKKRDLAPHDIAGVDAIYPAGKPTVTGGPGGATSSSSSSGGCSEAGGGSLALLGVPLALRRRRQRTTAPA